MFTLDLLSIMYLRFLIYKRIIIHMRKIDVDELKQLQLQILDQVSAYCERENIHYWIDCGTLLGAIRHKGFIPWDDDIDIGMLREDYDKFVAGFNKANDRYQCWTMDNMPDFPFSFAKVMDVKTELYEPNKKGGIKLCVNIDVFPYDNAPEDEQSLNQIYDKRDRHDALHRRRTLPKCGEDGQIKRIVRYILYMFLQIIPRQYLIDRINNNVKKYKDIETHYVGNFTSYARILCRKEVFDSFIDVEFEGKKYKAPVGYDTWLKAFYGDYMKLPPEEQQVSNHKFEAYVCE